MERPRRLPWWELPPDEQQKLIQRQQEIDREYGNFQVPWWDDKLPPESSLNKRTTQRKSPRRRKETSHNPSVSDTLKRTLSDEEITPFVSGLVDSLQKQQIISHTSIGAIKAAFPELKGVIPFAIKHGIVSPIETSRLRGLQQLQESDVITLLYMKRIFGMRGKITEQQLGELDKANSSYRQIIENSKLSE